MENIMNKESKNCNEVIQDSSSIPYSFKIGDRGFTRNGTMYNVIHKDVDTGDILVKLSSLDGKLDKKIFCNYKGESTIDGYDLTWRWNSELSKPSNVDMKNENSWRVTVDNYGWSIISSL